MFLTGWDLPNPGGNSNSANALGYTYDYNRYGEVNTGRPDFADSLSRLPPLFIREIEAPQLRGHHHDVGFRLSGLHYLVAHCHASYPRA